MTSLTALLLLAIAAEPRAEPHYPGASAVLQCMFESSHDEDVYGWPPGWTRRHGPGFPVYVRMRVDDNQPPPGGSSLRVELDGGAATAFGPAVAVSPDVLYVLEGYVETSGLRQDGAYLSLIFLDSKRTKLSSLASEKVSGTSPWQKICLGPVPPPAGATSMLIGVHVEPQGEMQDLRGTASFARVVDRTTAAHRVDGPAGARKPTGTKKLARNWGDEKRVSRPNANDAAFLLFPRGQPIEIVCAVSGFAGAHEVRLQLLDVASRTLTETRQGHTSTSGRGAGGEGNLLPSTSGRGAGGEGTCSPLPPGEGQGVRATIPGRLGDCRETWQDSIGSAPRSYPLPRRLRPQARPRRPLFKSSWASRSSSPRRCPPAVNSAGALALATPKWAWRRWAICFASPAYAG